MSARRTPNLLRMASRLLSGWFVEARTAEQRKRVRLRRQALGLACSLAIHFAIFAALLWMGVGRLIGETHADMGGGRPEGLDGQSMSFVIVSMAHSNAVGQTQSTAPAASASTGGPTALNTRLQTPDGLLPPNAKAEQGDSAKDAIAHDAATALTPSSPAAAAEANGVPNRVASQQGGDPDGNQNLLRQIARCLPPGSRPVIPFAKLTIELDQNGGLRLAPTLNASMPYASKDVVREADRIVQAALQCGPYRTSAPVGPAISLVPDFSFLTSNPTREKP